MDEKSIKHAFMRAVLQSKNVRPAHSAPCQKRIFKSASFVNKQHLKFSSHLCGHLRPFDHSQVVPKGTLVLKQQERVNISDRCSLSNATKDCSLAMCMSSSSLRWCTCSACLMQSLLDSSPLIAIQLIDGSQWECVTGTADKLKMDASIVNTGECW